MRSYLVRLSNYWCLFSSNGSLEVCDTVSRHCWAVLSGTQKKKNKTKHCPGSLFGLRINQERSWSQTRTLTTPSPTVCCGRLEPTLSSTCPMSLILVAQLQTSATWKLSFFITEWPLRQNCGGSAQWRKYICQGWISSYGITEIFWEESLMFVVENIKKFSSTSIEGQSRTVNVKFSRARIQNLLPRNPKLPLLFPSPSAEPCEPMEAGRAWEGKQR